MEPIVLSPEYRRKLLDRFRRYVAVETTSDSTVSEEQCPTTLCQFDLAEMLATELYKLGCQDVHVSRPGYVYATLPENLPEGHPAKDRIPAVGLMAHLDTAEAHSGKGVNPRVIANYQGEDITFPDDSELILRASDNPELANCHGFTIITASGKTLLGADDKSGVAEIMTIVEYLIRENVPHGEIRVCFNPDEETGHGTSHIDLKEFAVRYAFTLDGGREGEIEDECFNAKSAKVLIHGVNVHPGYAKGKMVSALRVFSWIMSGLPEEYFPENTEGREPYCFPDDCTSVPTVEKFEANFLLRAFTEQELAAVETILRNLCQQAEAQFPGSKITVDIKDGYRNMKAVMDQHPVVMELLESACWVQDIVPVYKPIRGGTDGSALTLRYNIPTPNIWSGSMNFHSRLEWVPLEWMASAVETTLAMTSLWVEKYSS